MNNKIKLGNSVRISVNNYLRNYTWYSIWHSVGSLIINSIEGCVEISVINSVRYSILNPVMLAQFRAGHYLAF